MSTNCFDSVPPKTRESAIEIAADLVRQIDGKHRSLACEAARKLKDMNDDIKVLKEEISLLNRHIDRRARS